ncbi:hypothetical protein JRO89_XS05G0207100 [Xanthoceras sorbifolium]|uniref:Uncharacterized protein n=1 Tax=Xanthoceras sorbifolium TaxID=99658 RepID=A0ABQ8I2S9_9ROSI|nr:hypothetical protein JRO89_XS05G0207100 [Xanthoceras sorbifolium]
MSTHIEEEQALKVTHEINFRDSVKLGNNTSLAVMGKGNVRLQVNGTTQIIIEVFYVLELKNNLLSIRQLQKKGLIVIFQHGRCKVFHSEKGLIMETKMSEKRITKLDDKSLSCVLLGVSEESKAYRLYGPLSQRIIISRDVVAEISDHIDGDRDKLEFDDPEEEDFPSNSLAAANSSGSKEREEHETSIMDARLCNRGRLLRVRK